MGLFGNQFANVVEWEEYRDDILFWKWSNQEIKKGSRLIIRPGQDAIFLYNGKVEGPSGIETYYNLPMGGCVKLMNHLGYYGTVWTRSDGVKMWDDYVMVAADLSIHPKGSLVETTLGTGIVVDTGDFVYNGSGVSLDIATAW